jgi:hypothetical protein
MSLFSLSSENFRTESLHNCAVQPKEECFEVFCTPYYLVAFRSLFFDIRWTFRTESLHNG